MNQQQISSHFEADHRRLDALFQEFQGHKQSDFEAASRSFTAFRTGLLRHIRWEEEVLFPSYERKAGMSSGTGPTEVMRAEHLQIKAVLQAIAASVEGQEAGSDQEEQQLLDILGVHGEKEELILYPMIDSALEPAEISAIFGALAAIDAEEAIPRSRRS